MCQVTQNKKDVTKPAANGCGGTCKAFVKYGQCPAVLKAMRDQQKQVTQATPALQNTEQNIGQNTMQSAAVIFDMPYNIP